MKKKLLITTLLMSLTFSVQGQGVINFANIGAGGFSPATNPSNGELFDSGFVAQLQLADGTNVSV